MALNIVELPYSYFPDFSRGRPLFNADIYVGNVDTDPEIPANQKQVTVRQEDGTEVQIAQPVKTSAGGVPTYNGSPVTVLVDGAYSIKVLDRFGAEEYYSPDVTKGTPITTETLPTYTDIVYKASGGNSAVENMIADLSANPTKYEVGTALKTGHINFSYINQSPPITLSNFRAFNVACILDFSNDVESPDQTDAIKTAVATGLNVFIPKRTYTLSETVSLYKSGQVIYCDSSTFDMTGKNFPAFTLGQNADGSLPNDSVFNISVRDLITTGDKTAGSSGLFFRKTSTNRPVNCRIWGCDYAVGTDAEFQGAYESLINKFQNCDFRFNRYGIYDPTGGFQASVWEGCRIEANDREGFSGKAINYYFNNCTIEGNSREQGQQGEMQFTQGSINVYITNCYLESFQSGSADHVNVFFNESPTLRLICKSSAFYNHANGDKLIGGLSTITEGLMSFDGCFFNDKFTGIYASNFTGNSYFTISNSLKQFSSAWIDESLFGGGGGYNISDRLSINTNATLNIDKIIVQSNSTTGGNVKRETTPFFVGLGDSGGTTILFPLSDLEITTPIYLELTITGRESNSVSRIYKVGATFNGDQTLADQQELYRYNMSAPVLSISGGNLVATNLSQFTTWSGISERCHSGFSL